MTQAPRRWHVVLIKDGVQKGYVAPRKCWENMCLLKKRPDDAGAWGKSARSEVKKDLGEEIQKRYPDYGEFDLVYLPAEV